MNAMSNKRNPKQTSLLIDFGPLRAQLREAAAAQQLSEAAVVRAAVRAELRRLRCLDAVRVPDVPCQDREAQP